MISIPKKNQVENKIIEVEIPKKTLQHCYIDPLPLLENCVFDELFIVQDAQVVEEIRKLLKDVKKNKINNLGIDFISPIELIEMNFKATTIVLLRVNIDNQKKFKENSSKFSVQSFGIDEKAYFLLNDSLDLKNLRKEIIKNKIKLNISNPKRDVILSQFKNSILIQEHRLSISSSEISLKIKGLFRNKSNLVRLKPGGMHSTFSLKKLLSRLPSNYVKEIAFLKPIENVSLNYYGFELEDEGEVIGVPKFDLLLTFKRNQNCTVFLDNIQKKYNLPIIKVDSSYKIGSQNLVLKQVNEKMIYLSTNKKKQDFISSSELFQIEGDLKMLTKIENSGWRGLVLDFIPGYQASKDLLETTDYLTMKRMNENTSEIKIIFKKDENTYHSLLKLLLLLSAE